jgi:hypothetical protein
LHNVRDHGLKIDFPYSIANFNTILTPSLGFRKNSKQLCQSVNVSKMKEMPKMYLVKRLCNTFYFLFFNYLMCRLVSGMADDTGNLNPLDPMDTEGEGEDDGTATNNLLKDADKLLNSPSTRKAPNNTDDDDPGVGIVKNTDTGTGSEKNIDTGEKSRSASVTSRLSNLGLSTNPGVPYQAVTDTNRARTHSGLTFGIGTGTGNGAAGSSAGCSDTGNKRGRTETGKKSGESLSHGNFPAAYNSVRKAKEKSNPCIELPAVDGNRRKMARSIRPLPGFDLLGDDRQFNVNNYHIPSMKRNASASIRRGDEGLFCVTCSEEHCFNGDDPICVFITDQAFPPSLPSDEGRCCVVLRLEDCLLSEQPGILKEFFGTRAGYLPEGSALFFGSLSHLALRGLENYAEGLLKYAKEWLQRSTCGARPSGRCPLCRPNKGPIRSGFLVAQRGGKQPHVLAGLQRGPLEDA